MSDTDYLHFQNQTNSTVSTNQQKQPVNAEDSNRSANPPTTVKNADGSTKEENYHMIPIDRKELETISNKDSNDEQQSKIKEENNSPENSSNRDKPSVKRATSNEEYV